MKDELARLLRRVEKNINNDEQSDKKVSTDTVHLYNVAYDLPVGLYRCIQQASAFSSLYNVNAIAELHTAACTE